MHRFLRLEKHIRVFSHSFFRCILWLNDTSYSKVPEWANRNLPARNTLVKMFTPVHWPWEPQCTALQNTDRQTVRRLMPMTKNWKTGEDIAVLVVTYYISWMLKKHQNNFSFLSDAMQWWKVTDSETDSISIPHSRSQWQWQNSKWLYCSTSQNSPTSKTDTSRPLNEENHKIRKTIYCSMKAAIISNLRKQQHIHGRYSQ